MTVWKNIVKQIFEVFSFSDVQLYVAISSLFWLKLMVSTDDKTNSFRTKSNSFPAYNIKYMPAADCQKSSAQGNTTLHFSDQFKTVDIFRYWFQSEMVIKIYST